MPRFNISAYAFAILTPLAALAGGPSFAPDSVFKGSSLAGWRASGQASWRAENGELIGVPKEGGGWLTLDRSFQDVGLYTEFRCTGGCRAGVLFRAEKTPQGTKGIYVSLTDGELASYAVTLDANGRETSRERLRPAGGQNRIAPPPDPNAAGRGGRGGFFPGRGAMPAALKLPVAPPSRDVIAGGRA